MKFESFLNETIKLKPHPQYKGIKYIENYKGLKRVYISKQGKHGYMACTDYPCRNLDSMIEINGEYWFRTLKDIKTAMENDNE